MHRDIKSPNIFVHNSQFKIGDFGFSKEMDIENYNNIGKNTILGSPTTMAPELLRK